MKLILIRYSGAADDTLGLLFSDGKFACFMLEDEYRAVKVAGETRIPEGTYKLALRDEGRLTKKYAARFPHIHRGMLWLLDVPGFEWIYIHCGNRDEHTDGCLLVGDSAQQNITEDGFIGSSGVAYKRIYPEIAAAIERGDQVTISVRDIELEK